MASDQQHPPLNVDPDEFAFETKCVVLNFMGLVPSATPLHTTSSSSYSSGDGKRVLATQQSSIDSGPPQHSSWKQELTDLPELSIMEKFNPNHSEDELDHGQKDSSSPTKPLKRQSAQDFESPLEAQGATGGGRNLGHSVSVDQVGTDAYHQEGRHLGADSTPLQSYLAKSPRRTSAGMKKWRSTDAGEPGHLPHEKQMPVSPHKHKFYKAKKSADRPNTLPGLPSEHDIHTPKEHEEEEYGKDVGMDIEETYENCDDDENAVPQDTLKVQGTGSIQPSPSKSESQLGVDRQVSELSGISDESLPYSETSSLLMSGRSLVSVSSSYISVATADVATLVRMNTLPQYALPLKEEICKELEELEKERALRCQSSQDQHEDEVDHAGAIPIPPQPPHTPHSPETAVADYLRIIGDRVNEDYSRELDLVANEVMSQEEITYENLQKLALKLIKRTAVGSSGWSKVALLLLLGQRITFGILSHGGRSIHQVMEFISRLIGDCAADFILSRGGWHSITETLTPGSATDIMTPFPLIEGDGTVPSSTTTPSGTDTTTVTPLHDSAISSDLTNGATIQDSTTLESIASLAHDGEDFVDMPPLPSSGLRERRRSSQPKLKVDEATQANLPEIGASFEGVCSPEIVAPVQDEIGYLRQASTQLSEDMRNDARRSQWLSLAIAAAGVSLVGFAGYMIYRRYGR